MKAILTPGRIATQGSSVSFFVQALYVSPLRSAYVQILIALFLSSSLGPETLAADTSSSVQASDLLYFPRLGLAVSREMSIRKIDTGSPSERAHLKVGDRITFIEGRQVIQLNVNDRLHLLTGNSGTVSHLVIVRGNNPYSVAITRSDLSVRQNTSIVLVQTPLQSTIIQETELDRKLIEVESKTVHTDEVYHQVLKGLALLPPDVKRALLDYGVKIILAPSPSASDNEEGGCYYSPKDNQVVMHEPPPAKMSRFPITTLHELGHAYDWMGGRISTSADYQQLYENDLSSSKFTPLAAQTSAALGTLFQACW